MRIEQALDAIISGIGSEALRVRLSELEARKKILSRELSNAAVSYVVDMDSLVKTLREDAANFDNNTKPIIQKYIKKIQVDKDEIIIHTLNDLHTVGSPGWV